MKTLEQLNKDLDKLKAEIAEAMNKQIEITNGDWLEIKTNTGKYHVKVKDVNENGTIDVWTGYDYICQNYFKRPFCKVSDVTSTRKLSEAEILHLLTRYCTEELGIKAGVTVERSEELLSESLYPNNDKQVKIYKDNFAYFSESDELYIGGWVIYAKGHFAKVVEDVITIDGKEVEFEEHYPKIKGVLFAAEELAAIHAALACPDPLTAEKCLNLLRKIPFANENN